MTLASVTAAQRMTSRDLPEGLGPAVDDWVADLDHTTRSGKGMRSALFDVVYTHAGGDDEAVRAAACQALELLHEAFLVHDDVADGDDHRRGRPNLQGRTTARAADSGLPRETAAHVGMVGGLLGGDLLLVAAMGEFARLPVSAQVLHRAMAEVERAVVASIVGEYADVHGAAHGEPTTQERALAIGAAKTAAYSVTLPLVLGVVLAGGPEELIPPLRETGRHLGTAYQVIDDVLGVFGDPAVTGKSNEGDLVRRAPTVLLAFASATEEWPRIDTALGGTGFGRARAERVHPDRADSDRADPGRAHPDPATARSLLAECGAREHALGLAEDLVTAARAALDSPAVPHDLRGALDTHLATALERTR
ncbi:polyprenyl synthetase family protein [Dietzia psychralcaliphila]|uniref:Geranylgeranyl pyrophosphate synthase n=2 Tax=Dietzia psychralcaliphila TaxID=139021 RepID=A0AAD0NN61_9ACTN|nr:polyprenyl synthetase family protein [Dietzia psychralcaliphila]AWH96250.1 geranylgeranyl pyrophosphate synthase [Dietzia psychralcaliphila]PTM90675.1 geranylgeranyl diphosphate synthase type II [Dietzia psychralcaliphila]